MFYYHHMVQFKQIYQICFISKNQVLWIPLKDVLKVTVQKVVFFPYVSLSQVSDPLHSCRLKNISV